MQRKDSGVVGRRTSTAPDTPDREGAQPREKNDFDVVGVILDIRSKAGVHGEGRKRGSFSIDDLGRGLASDRGGRVPFNILLPPREGCRATPPRTRARLGFEVMRTSGLREVTEGTALVYTTIEGR